ncbi:vWA domain-containing protein [Amnibacterium setariae]|uniref:VWA domain-containing protein n=1 Tax=Amnibacterium setariae TaxID=2306585 RepID=A0A3A1TVW1_9MICO|nr:VWA domain-containing protein [Amnibacterium setariae]RIX28372.1 VWA domain-containing protein [Amnibacterium setariae]
MHRFTAPALVGVALLLAGGAVARPASAAPAEDPGSMMLVLDASGSMAERLPEGGTKIAAAKEALHDVVDGLPDAQRVGMRTFGATQSKASGRACTDSQRIADLGTGNRPALDAAVDRVKPFGETPIGYALQQAGKDLGATGQRTIVLVSDGEPTCAPDPCPVAASLAKDGISLRIDVVGLDVSGKARDALQCIADKGQGEYYDADSADDLSNALDTTATRAAQPFRETGTPVRGTVAQQGSPLLGNGDWLDTLGSSTGDRKTLYYRVRRTVEGSTLHVSVDSRARVSGDVIDLVVLGPEGYSCGQRSGLNVGTGFTPLITASLAIPSSLDQSQQRCLKAGDYVVQVTHGAQGQSSLGAAIDVPLELRVREEAPVRDVGSLPETASTPAFTALDLSEQAKQVVGGSSLAAATPIDPGAISGTIVPGELQAFSVDVDWGQSLAAQVRPTISAGLGSRLGSGRPPVLAVSILSPSRADAQGNVAYAGDPGSRRSNTALYAGSEGVSVYQYTNAVAYRNRFQIESTARAASEAGRYLVLVSLLTPGGDDRDYAVPFTMSTAVRGSAAGSPAYAVAASRDGTVGTATSAPSSAPSASRSGPAADGSRSRAAAPDAFEPVRRVVGVAAIALGVLALAGGIVALILFRLRRRAG